VGLGSGFGVWARGSWLCKCSGAKGWKREKGMWVPDRSRLQIESYICVGRGGDQLRGGWHQHLAIQMSASLVVCVTLIRSLNLTRSIAVFRSVFPVLTTDAFPWRGQDVGPGVFAIPTFRSGSYVGAEGLSGP
jgi:hypothetical protein